MDADAGGTERPSGVTHWDGPPLSAWHAWSPAELAARLDGLDVPWCVVGGWSIDLAAGRETREHEDLEIAILRPHLPAIRRRLGDGFVFHAVGDGEVRRLANGAAPPPLRHQTWVLDAAADEWRVDVMVEPGSDEEWVYRRDPSITAPRSTMVATTPDGIPYLRPHGALLYKAKATPGIRPKDEHDLVVGRSLLSSAERAWLATALDRISPGHPWRSRLDDG